MNIEFDLILLVSRIQGCSDATLPGGGEESDYEFEGIARASKAIRICIEEIFRRSRPWTILTTRTPAV